MSLFVLASKDGWVQIMYTGLDAVGVDQQVEMCFFCILYLLSDEENKDFDAYRVESVPLSFQEISFHFFQTPFTMFVCSSSSSKGMFKEPEPFGH